MEDTLSPSIDTTAPLEMHLSILRTRHEEIMLIVRSLIFDYDLLNIDGV
jgi:hypothetical protein